MYNYRRNLFIFSILLLVLGAIRTVSFIMDLGSWSELFAFGMFNNVFLILLLLCDIFTSVGAVVSGVIGILLRKKERGLIIWSVLSFIVCAAFVAHVFLIIANSSGEYSSRSSRMGLAYLAALPALQGLCYIGIEKNWTEKMNQPK